MDLKHKLFRANLEPPRKGMLVAHRLGKQEVITKYIYFNFYQENI